MTTPHKLTKTDFVDALSIKLKVSKAQAATMLDAFITVVEENMIKGNEVTLTGFGTFKVKRREARNGVNPKTGEKIKIAATKTVSFSVGKTLKEAVKATTNSK